MNDIGDLVRLSQYAGERFDLVQAGGGNTSVQLDDGFMLVKASGYLLSQVGPSRGYARVARQAVIELLDAPSGKGLDGLVVTPPDARPSIEIYFHAMLSTFTLHTHPLVVNSIVCRAGWREILGKLFPEALLVDYHTPGLPVALALREELNRTGRRASDGPVVVFLQNHGLIVSADTVEKAIALNEAVLARIERSLGCDMAQHKVSNRISALGNRSGACLPTAYRSQDAGLLRLLKDARPAFFQKPIFPDGAVFFGAGAVELQDLADDTPARHYEQQHGVPPAVIVFKDDVFFIAGDVRRAREIEEVFKAHVMALSSGKGDAQPLSDTEIAFLGNWEAEKYRRQGGLCK